MRRNLRIEPLEDRLVKTSGVDLGGDEVPVDDSTTDESGYQAHERVFLDEGVDVSVNLVAAAIDAETNELSARIRFTTNAPVTVTASTLGFNNNADIDNGERRSSALSSGAMDDTPIALDPSAPTDVILKGGADTTAIAVDFTETDEVANNNGGLVSLNEAEDGTVNITWATLDSYAQAYELHGPNADGPLGQVPVDNAVDVNGDGVLTALDSLQVINDINNGQDDAPAPGTARFTDVNADGHTTALDALQVINEYNRQTAAAQSAVAVAAEGEGTVAEVDAVEERVEEMVELLGDDAVRDIAQTTAPAQESTTDVRTVAEVEADADLLAYLDEQLKS